MESSPNNRTSSTTNFPSSDFTTAETCQSSPPGCGRIGILYGGILARKPHIDKKRTVLLPLFVVHKIGARQRQLSIPREESSVEPDGGRRFWLGP